MSTIKSPPQIPNAPHISSLSISKGSLPNIPTSSEIVSEVVNPNVLQRSNSATSNRDLHAFLQDKSKKSSAQSDSVTNNEDRTSIESTGVSKSTRTSEIGTKTPERSLENHQIASLVKRFGAPPHTAWLDPKYKIWSAPGFENAVGYVETPNKYAVVFGEPLCESSRQDALTAAFEEMCKDKKLETIYCATHEGFAKKLSAALGAAKNGKDGVVYVQFGVEEIIDPMSDNRTKSKNVKKANQIFESAKKNGVTAKEYNDLSEIDERLKKQCEALIANWLKNKKTKMHASRVQPFVAGADARWIMAFCGDKLVGLLTLTPLDSQKGHFIENKIEASDAPKVTSEFLIEKAISKLRDEKCHYLSWGIVPTSTLGEMGGLGLLKEGVARGAYAARATLKEWPDHGKFHKKFGVNDSKGLFAVFTKGFSIEKVDTLASVMKDNN